MTDEKDSCEPLTLLMCKLFRLLRVLQWQITNDPRQGFSWSPTLTGTSSRKEDKGGGSWHHILTTNNQILRKRVSEWQLLHSGGWLSRGAGWYGSHDDDPSYDCIFRYFLNIHLLGSFFQGTKMRNSSSNYFFVRFRVIQKAALLSGKTACICVYAISLPSSSGGTYCRTSKQVCEGKV